MSRIGQERILVTGATGFVGSWLLEDFQATHPQAVLFGTTHSGVTRTQNGVTLLPCDITDTESVRHAVQTAQPNRVVHLAGVASAAGEDTAHLRAVNADAAVTLLRAVADQAEECRVLLASSGYVYGVTEPGHPATESTPLRPIGAYAESKVAMEEAVYRFMNEEKPDATSVILARAFNHTGPRQTDAFVVPAFAKQIARIEAGLEPPVVKVGNLEALRDFLHVRDVVRAYRQLTCEIDLAETVLPINVGSGVGVTIRSILDQLVALSSVPVTVETDPARLRPSDLPECIGDPALLTERTGWLPTTSIRATVQETLDFWRAQSV